MKRVLHISKYYPPFVGGTEQVAADCVRALAGLCEQRVICFNHEPGTRREEADGVQIVRAGCFAKVASQSLSLDYGRLLRREIETFRPDVVVFHYPNPFVAHLLLRCLPKGAKLVVYWHLDIVKQKLLKRLFEGQNRRLTQRADRLIATSPAYAQASPYLNGAGEKCRVVPNCIDAERLRQTPESREMSRRLRDRYPGKVLCLAVGRHTRYKGFDVLIEAARLLDDRFQVLIAGEGEETEALRRQAEGLERVTFLGRVGEAELIAWLWTADIFCFSSVTRNEAFGLALAEAMYCEQPAVTFTIPGSGVNFVCPDGVGGLEVPNGDAGAYAEAMKRLADDPELRRRLGQAGRRRVESHFLYEQFRQNLRGLMDELTRTGESGQ